MPTVITEGARTGEFLVSEASGHRSRDVGTLLKHSETYASGTVLGQITVSKKWTRYDNAAGDGTEVAKGVLYANVDASAADTPATIIARDAEVNDNLLVWKDGLSGSDKTAGRADLVSAGIITRA